MVYDSLVALYREEGWRLPENQEMPKRFSWRRKWLGWLDSLNEGLYPIATGLPFERLRNSKLRYLDSLVTNQFLNLMENGLGDDVLRFQTVRSPFEEGRQLFPGAMFRTQTHIQIAVRDSTCIHVVDYHEI
jgi:hypothetical protein